MHPYLGARICGQIEAICAAKRLVLGDFIGVVDFAVINAAGVDVEGETEHFARHDRAFEMPARSALSPWRIPFHLALFTSRRFAPDREVRRISLALNRLDAAFAIVGVSAGETAIICYGGDVEIETAIEFVAVLFGDGLGECDHLRHVVGRNGPLRGLADIQRADIGPVRLLVMLGDVPNGLGLRPGHLFHLVLTIIGIIGKMADIGDVDDVGELIAVERKRAPQHIGKDIGTHVPDVGIVINRRPARIDARLACMNRLEWLQLAGQTVEQAHRSGGGSGGIRHGIAIAPPLHAWSRASQ